jgi:hypothetical protein
MNYFKLGEGGDILVTSRLTVVFPVPVGPIKLQRLI